MKIKKDLKTATEIAIKRVRRICVFHCKTAFSAIQKLKLFSLLKINEQLYNIPLQ